MKNIFEKIKNFINEYGVMILLILNIILFVYIIYSNITGRLNINNSINTIKDDMVTVWAKNKQAIDELKSYTTKTVIPFLDDASKDIDELKYKLETEQYTLSDYIDKVEEIKDAIKNFNVDFNDFLSDFDIYDPSKW